MGREPQSMPAARLRLSPRAGIRGSGSPTDAAHWAAPLPWQPLCESSSERLQAAAIGLSRRCGARTRSRTSIRSSRNCKSEVWCGRGRSGSLAAVEPSGSKSEGPRPAAKLECNGEAAAKPNRSRRRGRQERPQQAAETSAVVELEDLAGGLCCSCTLARLEMRRADILASIMSFEEFLEGNLSRGLQGQVRTCLRQNHEQLRYYDAELADLAIVRAVSKESCGVCGC